MIIKKYHKQKETFTSKAKLFAYLQQAKSYRQTPKKEYSGNCRNALRVTLSALIPLAAVTTANTQCLGPLNPNSAGNAQTITLGTGASYTFDIDGEGNKLRFVGDRHPTKGGTAFYLDQLDGLNIFEFVENDNTIDSDLDIILSSVAINNGLNWNFCSQLAGNGGLMAEVTKDLAWDEVGDRGYVGIRKDGLTGFYGFIEIEVMGINYDGVDSEYKIKVHERGMDTVAADDDAAVAGVCSSLPVEMLYFRAHAQQSNIRLEWATASEDGNAGFEIQRSTDGIHFHKKTWIKGVGTTFDKQYYSFTDENVETNTSYYYRLVQYDLDGSFSNSVIITGMLKNASKITIGEVFPNPVSKKQGVAWLPTNLPEESPITVVLFSDKGVALETFEESLPAGTGNFPIPLYDLPSGIYYVKTQVGQQSAYRKLVVVD